MQKSCRCGFMYGELTDKETIARIEECLEGQIHDQFEILLYKKNSKYARAIFTSHGRSLSVVFVASFVAGIDDFHFGNSQESNPSENWQIDWGECCQKFKTENLQKISDEK
ncbi:hypothetical protein K0M31_006268 [Melipona bicolor]|uniref:Uncharacterized protein n=1 Tax=Melipona bicolor TaxID=60889 RepID=A0AA40FTX6_9HYME|nr:hypothetical protein K0M31_006268 [Melipona bicolor]